MVKALGIISFEDDNIKLEGMAQHRPLQSISFLGRYRLVDFPISNLTNSGVNTIHLHVKEKPRSVFEHVGTGRQYNINSKHGKLRMMYGEGGMTSSIYNTDIHSYLESERYLLEDSSEYVIIVPSHFIYLQDFRGVLEHHIQSKADVTVLYKKTDLAKTYYHGCTTLTMDKEKRITATGINRGQFKNRFISLSCYILKKSLFIELCHKAYKQSPIYWFKHILQESLDELDIRGMGVSGTCLAMTDLKSYYDANMSLIEDAHSDLFDQNWTIYTRTNDSVPVFYGKHSDVKNCLVANGSVILGEVVNCVIGRNVVIEEGAKVVDCILLPNVKVGKDVYLKGLVVDKHATIDIAKEIVAKEGEVMYINRHDHI